MCLFHLTDISSDVSITTLPWARVKNIFIHEFSGHGMCICHDIRNFTHLIINIGEWHCYNPSLWVERQIRERECESLGPISKAFLPSSLPTVLAKNDTGLYYHGFCSYSDCVHYLSKHHSRCRPWFGPELDNCRKHHATTASIILDISWDLFRGALSIEKHTGVCPNWR